MNFSDEIKQCYKNARTCAINNDASGAAKWIKEMALLYDKEYKDMNKTIIESIRINGFVEKLNSCSAHLLNKGLTKEMLSFFEINDVYQNVSMPNISENIEDDIDLVDEMLSSKTDNSNNISKNMNTTNKVKMSYGPMDLNSFIGQKPIINRLLNEISAAKFKKLNYIDSILLFGNKGLGKSTLMRLIAAELNVRFEYIDCTTLNSSIQSKKTLINFLKRIESYKEPVVICFDEIGFLSKSLQSMLLTLLNDRVFSYIDKDGITYNLAIDEFTFIGATTDPQDLLATLKDRCKNLTFFLEPYSTEELRQIFLNKFKLINLRIANDALELCIVNCRDSLREVSAIVKALETITITTFTDYITLNMVEDYFNGIGTYNGLNKIDISILKAIFKNTNNVVSVDTLVAIVGLDIKTYLNEYEPYLIKSGVLNISSKGRELTENGIEIMKGIDG